uniref:Epidermal patterning factor-like protein n=1 Tax=Kalanchoe fedtschenkoi TaxID=63787 RepID=A0A7N0UZT1_KALFE
MGLGRSRRCFFWFFVCRGLVLPLIFLLVSSSTGFRFVAGARAQPGYQDADQKTGSGIREQMIGSRPPRCQLRCSGCGPCEAVQVPVSPQLDGRRRARGHFYEARETEYSRGDDVTNYKPMGWRCKCGNLIFNP